MAKHMNMVGAPWLHAKSDTDSMTACSRHVYKMFFFVHIQFVLYLAFQRNASAFVAKTYLPFLQRTAPIARSLCEDRIQHDIHILVTARFYFDRKARAVVCKALHRGSKQQ